MCGHLSSQSSVFGKVRIQIVFIFVHGHQVTPARNMFVFLLFHQVTPIQKKCVSLYGHQVPPSRMYLSLGVVIR